MDNLRINEMLNQASKVYSSACGCMPGLQKWAESFDGEEEKFAKEFYDYVLGKNRYPSTRVFSIDSLLRDDFLNYLFRNKEN